MGCNTPFGRVIGHEAAPEPLQRNRFRHRTEAALPKNGFAFAIENIIAGIGQFQNTAEQICLDSSAVDPKWMRDNPYRKFDQSNKRRQRNTSQRLRDTQIISRQGTRNSKQSSATQDKCERIIGKEILTCEQVPKAPQSRHIKAADKKDKSAPKRHGRRRSRAND